MDAPLKHFDKPHYFIKCVRFALDIIEGTRILYDLHK